MTLAFFLETTWQAIDYSQLYVHYTMHFMNPNYAILESSTQLFDT